jgi:hypothetical protein
MKVHTHIKYAIIIALTLLLWFYSTALASFNPIYLQISNQKNETPSLEGKTFKGKVKAKGLLGLFKVSGTLSFQDNLLTWQVDDEVDTGVYKIIPKNGLIHFSAHVKMTSGESVDWQGYFNGTSLIQVSAIWTRVEGDFIHDLFLPPVVTMIFLPEE